MHSWKSKTRKSWTEFYDKSVRENWTHPQSWMSIFDVSQNCTHLTLAVLHIHNIIQSVQFIYWHLGYPGDLAHPMFPLHPYALRHPVTCQARQMYKQAIPWGKTVEAAATNQVVQPRLCIFAAGNYPVPINGDDLPTTDWYQLVPFSLWSVAN